MAGGDPRRGEAIFFGEKAKCSSCHRVGGKGGEIGPDLSKLSDRDAASVYRDIADPNATINPDYLPFTVALKDGRVIVGVVRANDDRSIRVLDNEARATEASRAPSVGTAAVEQNWFDIHGPRTAEPASAPSVEGRRP